MIQAAIIGACGPSERSRRLISGPLRAPAGANGTPPGPSPQDPRRPFFNWPVSSALALIHETKTSRQTLV
jgi:hypothetical protein